MKRVDLKKFYELLILHNGALNGRYLFHEGTER